MRQNTIFACILIASFPVSSSKQPLNSTMNLEENVKETFSANLSGVKDHYTETTLSSNDIAQRLSQAHFEFTLKLYPVLVCTNKQHKNIAFSPLLLSTLLTSTLLTANDYSHILAGSLENPGTLILPQEDGAYEDTDSVRTKEVTIHKMFLLGHQIKRVGFFYNYLNHLKVLRKIEFYNLNMINNCITYNET